MDEPYKLGDMLKSFPAMELCKMMTNIDRFEQVVPQDVKDEMNVIEKVNEISEKIIEDNL